MGLRVFLAVPVADEAVLSKLRALLEELKALRGVRTVQPHQLHFTLRFFEDLDEGKFPKVRSAAEKAAHESAAFSLELKGVGVFPAERPARVVWAGCGAGAGALVSLARGVEGAFSFEGFAAEPRPFAPHLTLARVKDPRAARAASSFAAAHASFDAGAFEVRELVLFQSVLGRDGASHTPLGRFALTFAPHGAHETA